MEAVCTGLVAAVCIVGQGAEDEPHCSEVDTKDPFHHHRLLAVIKRYWALKDKDDDASSESEFGNMIKHDWFQQTEPTPPEEKEGGSGDFETRVLIEQQGRPSGVTEQEKRALEDGFLDTYISWIAVRTSTSPT